MGTTNRFTLRCASGVTAGASASISDNRRWLAQGRRSAELKAGRLDRAGALASIACAIHCATSPLILPLLPLVAGRVVGPAMEWAFVAISFILGISSLAHSYRALHRDRRAVTFFASGFTMLLLVRVLEPAGIIEPVAVVGATALIVSAHLLNLHLRRGTQVGVWKCPCPCTSSDPTIHDTLTPRTVSSSLSAAEVIATAHMSAARASS